MVLCGGAISTDQTQHAPIEPAVVTAGMTDSANLPSLVTPQHPRAIPTRETTPRRVATPPVGDPVTETSDQQYEETLDFVDRHYKALRDPAVVDRPSHTKALFTSIERCGCDRANLLR